MRSFQGKFNSIARAEEPDAPCSFNAIPSSHRESAISKRSMMEWVHWAEKTAGHTISLVHVLGKLLDASYGLARCTKYL